MEEKNVKETTLSEETFRYIYLIVCTSSPISGGERRVELPTKFSKREVILKGSHFSKGWVAEKEGVTFSGSVGAFT